MDLSLGVYGSWKSKQLEKYRELVPQIKEALERSETALDIGVGKAWFWEYSKNEGYSFNSLKGVDISKHATEPEKSYIKYTYSNCPELEGEFELVVLFDSVHLIDYADRIPNYISGKGYVLQSVPLKFREKLERYKNMETASEGEVGIQERDHYLLQRKR